jgi:hypothetical protein
MVIRRIFPQPDLFETPPRMVLAPAERTNLVDQLRMLLMEAMAAREQAAEVRHLRRRHRPLRRVLRGPFLSVALTVSLQLLILPSVKSLVVAKLNGSVRSSVPRAARRDPAVG